MTEIALSAHKKAAGCPICGRPGLERFRPFCSARCADVDLNRWLSNSYAIPAEDAFPDEDAERE